VAALRAEFASDVRTAALQVTGDVDITPVNDLVKKASMTAMPSVGHLRNVNNRTFFQHRTLYFADSTRLGATSIATTQVRLERQDNQIKGAFVTHFDSMLDQIARIPTGIGGVKIEHSVTMTIEDFDRFLQLIESLATPFAATDLLPAVDLVSDFTIETTVSTPGERSITFTPGLHTWRNDRPSSPCPARWRRCGGRLRRVLQLLLGLPRGV
jgi:hypothetical protein